MDSERIEELDARLAVMELILLGMLRSLSRRSPALAGDVLKALQNQRARLDLSAPRAAATVDALTESIQALEQILAQKHQ